MNIIFKGTDGSIAIMNLADGADKEETIRKFRDSHDDGKYPEYYEKDMELPSDREFRDAWTLQDNKIVVNEKKAKDIHMNRIRHGRNMELEKLDKEQLRHINDTWKLQEVETRKQELRDLPAKWDTLQWPVEHLGERK